MSKLYREDLCSRQLLLARSSCDLWNVLCKEGVYECMAALHKPICNVDMQYSTLWNPKPAYNVRDARVSHAARQRDVVGESVKTVREVYAGQS